MPTAYADPDVETPEPTETPEPQAAVPCATNPCWSPTPITFTHAETGLRSTVTPGFSGVVVVNWGDGSTSRGRGPQSHTYAAGGTYQVVASPIASACASSSAQVPVTVA